MTYDLLGSAASGPPSGSGGQEAVIAVVIPAYRAAQHIERVLAGIPSFVRHVIVVDDCSPDDTARLVEEFDDPRVCLLRHAENHGVGGAMITGYRAAVDLGAHVIVKMDSDDQMDPAYIAPLIAPILRGDADYAKGNRFVHWRELKSMPLVRRIGNAALSFLTKLASGYWNIFDPTNGFTAIATSIVPLLNEQAIERRYFFESSMLIELGLLRAVVVDAYIPARYQDEVSSLSESEALLEFPWRLTTATGRRVLTQYFIRDFSAVSVFLLAGSIFSAFGIVWGAYHWLISASIGVPASTGTVMVAVLPLILGLQLLLQAVIADIQNVPVRPLHPTQSLLSLKHRATWPRTD